MRLYSLPEHFLELKSRFIKILLFFLLAASVSYYFAPSIYSFILRPLDKVFKGNMIYTDLTEAFLAYLKLSFFCGFCVTFPFALSQIYLFISPGLYEEEKKIIRPIFLSSFLLFLISLIFVYYLVMPAAWKFFLSFESRQSLLPIVLQAKVNEYLSLFVKFILAFAFAFQLPIVVVTLNLLNIVSIGALKKGRRFAILINFIIAGIITPPDAASQIALALPMILLYEISLIVCRRTERRKNLNAGH